MRARMAASLTLLALAAAGLSACGDGGREHGASARAPTASEPPLRPPPRVVVALSPGEQPPPGALTEYGSGSEAQSFEPPSDAEVKQELAELHASKVSGSGAYTNPFGHVAGLTPERIDMGVDYGGAGPVVAI